VNKGPFDRTPSPRAKAGVASPAGKSWHAVSIACGSSVCAEALKLRQVRFLSRDAPRLPLPDCTSPGACRCVYKHHPDRRSGPRRMMDRPSSPRTLQPRPIAEERRRPGRRRASDP
jgi:hypothetical protein